MTEIHVGEMILQEINASRHWAVSRSQKRHFRLGSVSTYTLPQIKHGDEVTR